MRVLGSFGSYGGLFIRVLSIQGQISMHISCTRIKRASGTRITRVGVLRLHLGEPLRSLKRAAYCNDEPENGNIAKRGVSQRWLTQTIEHEEAYLDEHGREQRRVLIRSNGI